MGIGDLLTNPHTLDPLSCEMLGGGGRGWIPGVSKKQAEVVVGFRVFRRNRRRSWLDSGCFEETGGGRSLEFYGLGLAWLA